MIKKAFVRRGPKELLTSTPVIVSVAELSQKPNPTCAEVMQAAAWKGEKNRWPIIQFEHENPPIFKGVTTTSRTVTLVDSSVFEIPKEIIHLNTGTIKVNGYVKVSPYWKTDLERKLIS